MSTLLQVAQLGQSVLRRKAKLVRSIASNQTQKLIDNLIATVMDVNGVGIAAPQVYESVRIIVIASHPNPRYPNAPEMAPTAMINPRLVSHSMQKVKDWEGCLSIPGIRGLVPRYKAIKVEYVDRKGKKQKASYTDFIARIFQHEIDHLDGIVFLDRIDSTRDLISDKEYMKLVGAKK